ncbi:hypothetical protein PMAYCL1PPCAC_15159 [Pristionchus mayeri]|uniref:F-box domain-containing protein n=1 Tax=Pristionchus mayeri TaxID=1317129 RepID=A0AAN5CIB4_9BILA|nr:hypothetical protein PMAYCL1PPCAC_15159 [Pristionchus mayeri]
MTMEDFSPLEHLPREIVYSIIEYAPESAFALRLTCRMLRSHVDEFALQRGTIILADEVRLFCSERVYYFQITINTFVPASRSNLFELRLKLRDPSNCFRSQIERSNNINFNTNGRVSKYNKYVLKVVTPFPNEEEASSFEYLVEAVGPQIGLIDLSQISHEDELNLLWNLSESFPTKKLSLCIPHLHSSRVMSNLLSKLEARKIDYLMLNALKIPEPQKFMLDVSLLVRSLHIRQYDFDVHRLSSTNFLGAANVDWAPTIIEMFSRRLDTLKIENEYYCDYLSKASADELISKLPHIGKKVWFRASYYRNPKGVNYKVNSHIIKACRLNASNRVLSIKHKSRLKEEF